MKPLNRADTAATGRRRLVALAAATLLLAGCGAPAPDPGAERSAEQAKELRDRIVSIQGRR